MLRFYYIIFTIIFHGIISSNLYAGIKQQNHNHTTIYSDKHNTIWIGTEHGLFQWINQDTRLIPSTTNMHVTAITSVYDYIIIGTKEGSIYKYAKLTHSLTYQANLKVEISCIQFDEIEKEIAVSTKGNGYFILDYSGYTHHTTSNGLPDNFIYQIQKDKHTQWWCASDKGLSVYNKTGRQHHLTFKEKIPDPLVTCFAFKNDLILCGTQSGDICKLNLKDSSISVFNRNVWNSGQVNDILFLEKSIYIATEQGAFLLDTLGNLRQSLVINKPVNKITIDLESNVWICGSNLLASYSTEQIKLIKNAGELIVNHVHSVLVDSMNTQLWFTPDQGLTKYHTINFAHQSINITPPNKLIDITSLYIDVYGTLWVGTFGKGLFSVDTHTLKSIPIPIDTADETSSIISITSDKKYLWVTSLNGVWRRNLQQNNAAFSNLEDEYQKKKIYVYQVFIDHKNNTWLATDGQGMQLLASQGISQFNGLKNVKDKVFYGAAEDHENQMWFLPYENGLYCMQHDSLIHLHTGNGLSSNDVSSLRKYNKNFMLAATSVGLDLIDIHTKVITHFAYSDIEQGILPEINSMNGDGKSIMYIGTNKGIIEFNLPAFRSEFKPKAIIDDILVMEKSVKSNIDEFPYDQNFLRFRINAIWNSQSTIFYRYKLEGLNNQWNQTVDKEILFPRLNPGTYKFILEVSNNKSFYNASQSSYSFTIRNPYYKQYWFLSLLVVSIILIIYYFMRYREKRISRLQQLETEKLIAEYETLKNQVNPHFLFNSLNTLIQVIDEDKDKAIEYTQTMSEFYRSVLTYRDVNLINLHEELNLLEKYIYLQKMRYGNNFIYANECETQMSETMAIPPLTLQLLAENAIKHNAISNTKTLTLKISCSKNFLIVSNNINKKEQIEYGENIGIQNIVNRYRLFTHHHVEIIHDEHFFKVKLPLLKIH